MEPKALPPAKINSSKLLGASKSNIIAKKISVKSFDAKDSKSNQDILIIKKQVIKIKDLIATNTLLKAKEEERKRKESEQKRFAKKEEKLEAKKEPGQDKLKLPATPKLGFLERIKKFLFSIILGKIAIALLPNLPKLSGVFSAAFSIQNTIIDYGGKILDGLMTFVDKGYEAYDQSGKLIKNFGGDPLLKLFEGLTGSMSKMIDAAIIAAIAFSELRGDSGKPDITKPGRGVFGKGLGRAATRLGIKTIGKDATKNALSLIRPLVKRAPLIGGLLEFGISWALGDPLPKAAFRGVGSILLGAIGTAIGGPIGLAIGGYAGGELAGVLYDMFFNNKTPTSTKVQGRAQGGSITRGGKLQSGPKRELRGTKKVEKYKRVVAKKPGEVKIDSPGTAIGGEEKLFGLFPKPSLPQFASPFNVIKNTGKELGKGEFFGPILAISSKITAGQLPTEKDYQNVGLGINLLISKGIQDRQLKGGVVPTFFAEGGLVDPDVLSAVETGGDISNWVAKTFKGEIESNAQRTLRMIRENAAKEQEKGKGIEPTGAGGMAGQYSPEGIQGDIYQYLLSKGLSDAHALGIMANISRESGFRPGADQPGGPGVGLFQYSSAGRKAAFLKAVPNYATNWKGQIDYALKEDAAPRYLQMKFSSSQEAADWWMREWERPAEYIQNTEGPRIHKEYLASLEKYRTKKGYQIPTSADVPIGSNIGNLNLAKQLAESMGVPLYSHVRRDNPDSYHYDGRAMDFSNDSVGRGTPQQLSLAKELVKRYGSTAKEIIYTPLGFSIKNGRKVSPIASADHYDHVHVAFAKGGKVHGFTRAILGEKGPEFVIDADSTRALEDNYPGFLNALNKSDYSGALSVLRNYASYESGAATQVIIDKEIVPILFPMPTAAPSGPIMTGQNVGEDYMAYGYQHG